MMKITLGLKNEDLLFNLFLILLTMFSIIQNSVKW